MVYILAANKYLKYKNGRSRILYIGTTKKGAGRPAASAVNKASEVFYELHGVKTVEVHVASSGPRKAMPTWPQGGLAAASRLCYKTESNQLPLKSCLSK